MHLLAGRQAGTFECPLEGACLTKKVVYRATVKVAP